ncbi:MAG: hypothetical protein KAI33_01155 [Elusimicrobiales bacterium]|nr:hypothetical protein [Elusimicrobiales bacterium]
MKKNKIFFLLMFFCSIVFFGARQNVFGAFEDIALGARGEGLANSVTAIEGMDSMTINPAAFGSVRKFMSGTHFLSSHRTGAGDANLKSYSLGVLVPRMFRSRNGTMGFLFRYRLNHGYTQEKTMQFGYSTWQLLRTEKGILDFGANFKILGLTAIGSGDSANSFALDIGSILRLGDGKTVGLSFLNINNPAFNLDPITDKAPFTTRIGYSEDREDYLLSIDFVKRSGSSGSDGTYSLNSGYEYLWRTYKSGIFSTRAGLSLGDNSSSLSMGMSYKLVATEIFYSFSLPLTRTINAAHALSLVIRFGARDIESEYERLIKQEVKYRRDLMEALDESAKREMILKNELNTLKEETDALKKQLNLEIKKTNKTTAAKKKLESIISRQKKAARELERLERERKQNKLNQLRFQFSHDWQNYLKLKTGGAPKDVLKGVLGRIISSYQDVGIDISQATLELQRVIK